MHFIKNFSQFIFYIVILLAPLCAKAQEPEVIISKIEFLNEKKLSITLNKITEYKIFTLNKPDRLSIEIKNAKIFNKDYAPKKPDYISKITFSKNNQILVITLFFQEKYLVKNNNFDKKNKVISCDLELDSSRSAQYSQDEKNSLQKLILEKNQDKNIEVKKEDETNKLIVKKSSNSIVKYKIRAEKSTLPTEQNKDSSIKKLSQSFKKPVIIIDAGHGGKDPGTIGIYARTKEKNITLSYAKELAKHLINEKKYKVYLTRDDDFFIPLDKRVAKSRRKKADLFISLHANSIADKNISGFSIYTLSDNSSDKQAELLAQKENQADIINGIDFSGASKDIMKTLIDLSQRESKNSSARFAKFVIRDIKKAEIEILQNTHRFAGFMVLTAPDMASVLIELGYLSNRREEQMLNSITYRRLIAKTLTNSINQYFKNFK
jgi:N-acetylmuramoyl-L-alanine amidase